VHSARQDRAANDNGVAHTLAPEYLADLFTNPSNISQVEIAVGLARCADANEGQFRLADALARIAGGAQTTRLGSSCYDLPMSVSMMADCSVDQVDFVSGPDRLPHLMSLISQTSRRNSSNITQSKNADPQDLYLPAYAIRPSAPSAPTATPSIACFPPLLINGDNILE
jgi:hypothetical protein